VNSGICRGKPRAHFDQLPLQLPELGIALLNLRPKIRLRSTVFVKEIS
jgi:hypothetical protein